MVCIIGMGPEFAFTLILVAVAVVVVIVVIVVISSGVDLGLLQHPRWRAL